MNRLACLALLLCASTADAASILYVADFRQLSVQLVNDHFDPDEMPHERISAPPGFGDWSDALSFERMAVSIESTLSPQEMTYRGTSSSEWESCTQHEGCTGGIAYSRFAIQFEVTEPTWFEITGVAGAGTVDLGSYTGPFNSRQSILRPSGGFYERTGYLDPGILYELQVVASTVTWNRSQSLIPMRFTLAPEPGSIALVALGLTALSRRPRVHRRS